MNVCPFKADSVKGPSINFTCPSIKVSAPNISDGFVAELNAYFL